MLHKQSLSKEQALPKIRQYCAYQERCHKEVREKLYEYGLGKTDVEIMISQLIEENYLNEERFAILYAGGKFRIKRWGKNKIAHALREKEISSYCIKKALQEINTTDYEKALDCLAAKKWDLLKSEPQVSREMKARNYLLQKGFELETVNKVLQSYRSK